MYVEGESCFGHIYSVYKYKLHLQLVAHHDAVAILFIFYIYLFLFVLFKAHDLKCCLLLEMDMFARTVCLRALHSLNELLLQRCRR